MKRIVLLMTLVAGWGCESSTPAVDPAPEMALDAATPIDGAPEIDRGPDGAPDAEVDAVADAEVDAAPPPDSDGDGLSDEDERARGTDPEVADSDGDGIDDGTEVADGSDPLATDSDGDGIDDGDEVAEGTAPWDPSDAMAWRPDRVERPRLFMGPEDLDAIRAAVRVEGSPHAILYGRLVGRAAGNPRDHEGDVFETALTQSHGQMSEAAAFVGLIEGDRALLVKAAERIARGFPDPRPLGVEMTYDIREAQALAAFCNGFDLLAAAPAEMALDDEIAAARAGLVHRIDLYRDWVTGPSWSTILGLYRNNHTGKVLSTLGMCGMAVSDRREAAREVSDAITGLTMVLTESQGTAEGGHAEGWNYLSYGSNSYLPFMVAWHRYADGASHQARFVGTFAPIHPDRGEVVEVGDPVMVPEVRAVYERAQWVLMPDGRTPNTDDGDAVPLHGGLLAGLFDDARFLWRWADHDYFANYAEVATIASLDPAMQTPPTPAAEGEAPSGCFPEAGLAVMRDGWDVNDAYLYAIGEHGPVRRNGWGHEHPDATSLILWAHGENLLIDSGYARWDDRVLFYAAPDHNLVLVDGEGPPQDGFGNVIDSDAYIDDCRFGEGGYDTLRIRSNWAEADIERRVVRVDGRWYAVADAMDADGLRRYAAQWHGNGGAETPDSVFEATAGGGRWDRAGARLEVAGVAVRGDTDRVTRVDEHATGYGRWTTHMALSVEGDMGPGAGFLTLLVPSADGEPAPAVRVERVAPGVALGCVDDAVVVFNRTDAAVEVPLDACGLDGQRVDAPPGLSAGAAGRIDWRE